MISSFEKAVFVNRNDESIENVYLNSITTDHGQIGHSISKESVDLFEAVYARNIMQCEHQISSLFINFYTYLEAYGNSVINLYITHTMSHKN